MLNQLNNKVTLILTIKFAYRMSIFLINLNIFPK